MRKGHDAGADGWEIDVQTTADGELIILHDLNLLRTTNAGVHPVMSGKKFPLPWLATLEELKQLSADIFPRRFCPPHYAEKPWLDMPTTVSNDVCIPTLGEVLQLADKLGMWVNIEIKDLSRAVPAKIEHDIVERVLKSVDLYSMNDKVLLSSFNHSYMKRSKVLNPKILTGLLTEHKFSKDPVALLKENKADAWHPGFRFLTADIIAAVRECGTAINPYTVNEPDDVARLAKWGVTGLVTDNPVLAINELNKRT